MRLPKAKSENIVASVLKDEVLVYDLTTDQAFCLNDTAAKVFNACDGASTFDQLKNKHRLTDEIIFLTLDELKSKNLIVDKYTSPFANLSRREVIRRVGLASMIALPVISSLVAPTAAHAASGGCTQNSDCPPGSSACRIAVCTSGACGTTVLNYRTVVPGGVCDGYGNVKQCFYATDCPGQDTECQQRSCSANNYCGISYTAAGTVTTAGSRYICDGAGRVYDKCPQSRDPHFCF